MASTKEIVTRLEHAFAAGDYDTIDEVCDAGFVDHNPQPGMEPTLEGFKQANAKYRAAFPDLRIEELEVIADGDTAATRWTASGTHEAALDEIPATGKRVTVEGMNFYKLRDGKVTDAWLQFDGVGMLVQLGVLPAPEAAAVS